MKMTSGRTCLILALLGLSLAAAVSIGLNARYDGVTVQAHIAGMQLQGSPEMDEGSAAPDTDEGDKAVTCAQRAAHCPAPKREFALLWSDDGQAHESKTLAAPGDQVQPKSND